MSKPPPRAIGVVRVSRTGERDGESFVSPSEQRARIESFRSERSMSYYLQHEQAAPSRDRRRPRLPDRRTRRRIVRLPLGAARADRELPIGALDELLFAA